ncbi:MAG: prepilin peptidase [Gammaproteobacteria bacterium]
MFESLPLAPLSPLLRAQRALPRESGLERLVRRTTDCTLAPSRARIGAYRTLASRVLALDPRMRALDDAHIAPAAQRQRAALAGGCTEAQVVEAFALVRECARRVLGTQPYATQVIGALALFDGRIAEMATGEGKTLAATLTACVAALAGIPVHVVTVNDYLAARDAEDMRPLYEALGIPLGCVTVAVAHADRAHQYAAQVTYCTSKELVFDYLRDTLRLGPHAEPLRLAANRLAGGRSAVSALLQRGLHFAIVDEADSVLIDEAQTPLIISRTLPGREEELQRHREALALARGLRAEEHYRPDAKRGGVALTDRGRLVVRDRAIGLGSRWVGRARRESVVEQALAALLMFERDRHYLVRDGSVHIIDGSTGRLVSDRSWQRGLHQLIELKEGLAPTEPRETLARISYQQFFRRYFFLAGLTGTAWEVRGELRDVYRLGVIRVPLNRPCRRRTLATRVLPAEAAKWAAVVERIAELHTLARPVLIGAATVSASERLSALLAQRGLPHRLLNARQDRDEAALVAHAGDAGGITVATNMAGRGTDIRLAPGVDSIGGLHVLLTERHASARVDRQFYGRCARQGDPGSCEDIISLDDALLRTHAPGQLASLRWFCVSRPGQWLAQRIIRRAQKQVERRDSRQRAQLVREDERHTDLLAFSGRTT